MPGTKDPGLYETAADQHRPNLPPDPAKILLLQLLTVPLHCPKKKKQQQQQQRGTTSGASSALCDARALSRLAPSIPASPGARAKCGMSLVFVAKLSAAAAAAMPVWLCSAKTSMR